MIRGWFTAKLLNLVLKDSNGTVSIVHGIGTRSQQIAKFPANFLSSSNVKQDQLPLVLEALPLAFAAVGTAGNLDSLLPYIALRDLGMEMPGETQEVYSYSICNPVLMGYIETGEIPISKDIPGYKGVIKEIVGSDMMERATKITDFLQTRIDQYEELYDDYIHSISENPALLSRAPYWPELKDDISGSLIEIRNAVAALKNEGGEDF
jgi:hypothetical protein